MDIPDEEIGEDYADANLPGQHWEKRSFTDCDFTEADLRELVTSLYPPGDWRTNVARGGTARSTKSLPLAVKPICSRWT